MKQTILNIVLSVVIIIILVIGSLFIPRILPRYKNQITAHESKDTERFQYINATDTLDIYPWDQYTPESYTRLQSPKLEGTDLDLGLLLVSYIVNLFPEFLPSDDIDTFSQNLYTESDGEGTLYVKDYSYNNIYSEPCILNAVYIHDMLVYIRCRYSNQPELSEAQIVRTSKILTETLMYIKGQFHPSIEEDGADSIWPASDNPISTFLVSFSSLLVTPPVYDYQEKDWIDPEINLTDYSVIYYDHYFIISMEIFDYSGNQSTLYIFFDPTVEQVVGYSHQLF